MKRGLELLPNIGGLLPDIFPVTPVRDLEAMVFGKMLAVIVDCPLTLILIDIRDTLEEQQWEYVRLEIGCIYWAARNIRGFPEICFQFRQSNRNGVMSH